mgnify:CR=1 FL=1
MQCNNKLKSDRKDKEWSKEREEKKKLETEATAVAIVFLSVILRLVCKKNMSIRIRKKKYSTTSFLVFFSSSSSFYFVSMTLFSSFLSMFFLFQIKTKPFVSRHLLSHSWNIFLFAQLI